MNSQHAQAALTVQPENDLDDYEKRLVQRLSNETCEQLIQRILSQRNTIRAFSRCLDGLDIDTIIPGSGLESMRNAGDIRRVVTRLMGRAPAPRP